MSDIESRVKRILAERIGCPEESLDSDCRIVEDLGADSLDSVEVIMELEEEFHLSIPDGDVDENKSHTVGMIVDYIDRKLNPPQAATLPLED